MVWLKRTIITIVILVVFAVVGLNLFIYKVEHGIARYETDPPDIAIPHDKFNVLLFSKTTAFRHGKAIEAAKELIDSIAVDEGWFLYETEDAGIINTEQLSGFNLVIWNNSTGPVLNEEQRQVFKTYIELGGGFVGLHGAGDLSHKWSWYQNELICAEFSHHPVKNHLQSTTVFLSPDVDTFWNLPPVWKHIDEWYVFHDTPQKLGAKLLYTINGEDIDPNGDLLWMKGHNFGMGKIHPVAWYRNVRKGRSFYTSMGHTAETFRNVNFIEMIKEGILWAGNLK